jgi:hypothetical protein
MTRLRSAAESSSLGVITTSWLEILRRDSCASRARLSTALGTTGQRIALVGLAVTWAASWIADASAASTYLYIEPTDEAAARAAPRGVAASVVMLVAALAIAAVARRRWALVLVCPPILTGYLFWSALHRTRRRWLCCSFPRYWSSRWVSGA